MSRPEVSTDCRQLKEGDVVKYVINLVPVEWKRAGVNFSKRRFYDPQVDFKEAYRYMMREQHKDQDLFNCPLHLDVKFYMPLAKDKRIRAAQLAQYYHTNTPDSSNLIKFLEDAAVGILLEDDRIIAQISQIKVYDECPRTEFEFIPLLLPNNKSLDFEALVENRK